MSCLALMECRHVAKRWWTFNMLSTRWNHSGSWEAENVGDGLYESMQPWDSAWYLIARKAWADFRTPPQS